MTNLTREFVKVSAEVISVVNENQAGAHDSGEDIKHQSDRDQESSKLEGLYTLSSCERGRTEFLEKGFGIVQLQSILLRRGKHVAVVTVIRIICAVSSLYNKKTSNDHEDF